MLLGGAVAFGLAAGLAAVMAVSAAIVLLLIELGVVPWLAAVITAAATAGAAYALAQSGFTALRKRSIAPVETIHSLKETTQWLKHPSTR
jgi:hypothetical protein